VRFEVLTAPDMKMAVFWDVVPCSLVDIDRCFSVTLMMEAVSSSETLVSIKLHGATFQKTAIFNMTFVEIILVLPEDVQIYGHRIF
jgi:hypothetical protein